MSATVLVAGSLHYDIIVDAPGLPKRDETMVGSDWRPKCGGKGGNQAVGAARVAPSRMLGAVGSDDFGACLRAGLAVAGVEDAFVQIVDKPTGMSVAIVDPAGDYAAVIVSAANLVIDPSVLADDALWDGVKVLLLQNEVPESFNLRAATVAKARGVTVVLNAAPARQLGQEFAALVDVLVVNAVEAEMMCTDVVTDLNSAGSAAGLMAADYPAVVVTAGGSGLAAFSAGEGAFCCSAQAVVVQSTHGAGDAFTGTLAAHLAQGASLRDSCNFASHAAALHVSGATG